MASTETASSFGASEIISHVELQRRFGFAHVSSVKSWIEKNGIAYTPVGNLRWVSTDDVRKKLTEIAKPHGEWQAERAERREKKA